MKPGTINRNLSFVHGCSILTALNNYTTTMKAGNSGHTGQILEQTSALASDFPGSVFFLAIDI